VVRLRIVSRLRLAGPIPEDQVDPILLDGGSTVAKPITRQIRD